MGANDLLHIDEEKKYMTRPKHDRDSKKRVKTDGHEIKKKLKKTSCVSAYEVT